MSAIHRMASAASKSGSRAGTATSRAGTASSRLASGKSRQFSAQSVDRRAASAASLVRSLSRPSSAKTVAWSEDDTQDGNRKPIEPVQPVQPVSQEEGISHELEEELNRDELAESSESEPVGCWQQFTNMISSLWQTSDMAVGEEREVLVRTSFRELCIYAVFLVILCIVTLSAMSPTMYRYTDIIRVMFEKQNKVSQVKDFWKFMEKDFLRGLYWEKWYNKGDDTLNFTCPQFPDARGPCPIDPRDQLVMHANRLLGVPRMRQLRVCNDSCVIPEEFKSVIKVCYDGYSASIEDRTEFAPNVRVYTAADAWRYQSVKELEGSDHWGLEATYSGAGSIQNLRERRNDSLAIIRELKEGLWVGRGTRYVAIDFTLYNANVNLFCVIKLNFEFVPTGGVIPHAQFGTVRLLFYITAEEYAQLGIEIVFACFVLYYLVEEILEMKTLKLEYFYTFWNCLDLFVIIVSLLTLGFHVYCFLTVSHLLKGLLAEPELFADFSNLETWSKRFQDAAALTIFVGWIKVFKYISFNKTMAQLSGTIQRCAGDVAAFSIMFFIVFFAYAQIGYLMFGVHMKEFSTFKDACFTQFRLILGDFNFPAIEKSHRFWGPVYFLTYVFMVFFVLMNMFLAIINDTYSEVKDEVNSRKEEFQVGDFVMRGYNNVREMVHERDKLLDIRQTVKLAADDGIVTYDEIRENLRKLNFSDLEIEIFCARYDKDGNVEFNLDEINAIEENLGEQIADYDHLIIEEQKRIREEDGKDGDDDDRPTTPCPKMNNRQFAGLYQRVNDMEGEMTQVVERVEEVLKKLDTLDGNGNGSRNGSAASRKASAMSKGVRSIASARGGDDEKRREMANLVKEELQQLEDGPVD